MGSICAHDNLLLTSEQRVRSWFKNHSRPSTQQGGRKRDVFNLSRETRKLSDVQQFSKLYYHKFKKAIKKKWQKTYRRHYEHIKEDQTDVDEDTVDKQVHDSIRKDLNAGLLDLNVTAVVDDDDYADEEEDDVDEEKDDNDNKDKDKDKDDADDELSSVKVLRVAVWFRNAVMKDLWVKATPAQRDAVEQHRKEEAGEIEEDGQDENGGDGSLRKQVKQLQNVIRHVTTLIWQFF
jgi:hypothetical protein